MNGLFQVAARLRLALLRRRHCRIALVRIFIGPARAGPGARTFDTFYINRMLTLFRAGCSGPGPQCSSTRGASHRALWLRRARMALAEVLATWGGYRPMTGERFALPGPSCQQHSFSYPGWPPGGAGGILVGLLRLRSFLCPHASCHDGHQQLGTGCVLIASMLVSSGTAATAGHSRGADHVICAEYLTSSAR